MRKSDVVFTHLFCYFCFMQTINICIFASGKGSNALNIVRHLQSHPTINVSFILSNKKDAPIVEAASLKKTKVIVLNNEQVSDGVLLTKTCKENGVDFIILAGYLRKIPVYLLENYSDKIINVHPALLPKYESSKITVSFGLRFNFIKVLR